MTEAADLERVRARLLGRSIVTLVKAKNGLDASHVVRADGEVREFCFDADNRSWTRSLAHAFAGAGALYDYI